MAFQPFNRALTEAHFLVCVWGGDCQAAGQSWEDCADMTNRKGVGKWGEQMAQGQALCTWVKLQKLRFHLHVNHSCNFLALLS